MESQHSKCTQSIEGHFYNITPFPGSVPLVLASPDTEIPPKMFPRAQNLASPFLHEDILQSGHKKSLVQLILSSKRYPNLTWIAQLLHGTWCTPSCSLLGEAGAHRNACCNPNYRSNISVPSA